MIGSSPVKSQRNLFLPLLSDFIDMQHQLVLLGNAIDWEFSKGSLPRCIPIPDNQLCPSSSWLAV
jgi:hypothetical protein